MLVFSVEVLFLRISQNFYLWDSASIFLRLLSSEPEESKQPFLSDSPLTLKAGRYEALSVLDNMIRLDL